ncbi:hypothetical protein Ciccas_001449 [Cichlidogyrus casuarinus]|uniref:SCP domain-containing protein n=1 Tax=Cichlidogyrus casuarinus TaxID=1844966 RepID=A0ABD2QK06_9PLAT
MQSVIATLLIIHICYGGCPFRRQKYGNPFSRQELEPSQLNNPSEDENPFLGQNIESRAKVSISVKDKKMILQQHNEIRAKVRQGLVPGQPADPTMKDLKWDDKLAKTAAVLANKCKMEHDKAEDRKTPNYEYVGQNLAAGPQVDQFVGMWYGEYKDYTYKSNSCVPGKMCGHYTQVVWDSTTHVGCAVKKCPRTSSFQYGNFLVCNYGPGLVSAFSNRHFFSEETMWAANLIRQNSNQIKMN